MSGIVQREGNRIDATYDNPWGGVASNADDADIQPSQFVKGDGLVVKNGVLCAANWGNTTLYNFSKVANQHYWLDDRMQYVILVKPNNAGWVLCAFDNNGHAFIYDGTIFFLDQTLLGGSFMSISCIQVIGGVVYIFDWSAGKVYKYIPHDSYTVASTYVGGKYCMVVTNYLITVNTNMASDGAERIKENRYNWSAPFAYSTWDPQDPALPRSAGSNTLTSAQDQISGCFAMGNVGYILRTQGLTQLTPTGIGISPFDTTDLWASQFGIGCTYPDSLAQYGALAIWFNNNDGYAFFSGAMPQSITGAAQRAIFADLNAYEGMDSGLTTTRVSGTFANTSENSQIPELIYILGIISYGTGVPGGFQAIVWVLNLAAKAWTRHVFNIADEIFRVTGVRSTVFGVETARVIGVQEPRYLTQLSQASPRRVAAHMLVSTAVGATVYSFLFSLYYNETGTLSLSPAGKFLNIKCRQEEVVLGAKPTVRGVIIKAAGTGTLKIAVSGTPFKDVVVISPTARTYKSHGEVSLENPQLTINATDFDGFITKVHMNMTYAEGSQF